MWLALQAVPDDAEIIIVHDAVRPLITRDLIASVVRAAAEHGAAICALPIAETVKRVRNDVVDATLDRSELWAVQTPQAFRAALLREAHEKARRDGWWEPTTPCWWSGSAMRSASCAGSPRT